MQSLLLFIPFLVLWTIQPYAWISVDIVSIVITNAQLKKKQLKKIHQYKVYHARLINNGYPIVGVAHHFWCALSHMFIAMIWIFSNAEFQR